MNILFAGGQRRRAHEHNDAMQVAYVAAQIPYMKKPPTLRELLIEADARPRRRMDWKLIKAALQVVFPDQR